MGKIISKPSASLATMLHTIVFIKSTDERPQSGIKRLEDALRDLNCVLVETHFFLLSPPPNPSTSYSSWCAHNPQELCLCCCLNVSARSAASHSAGDMQKKQRRDKLKAPLVPPPSDLLNSVMRVDYEISSVNTDTSAESEPHFGCLSIQSSALSDRGCQCVQRQDYGCL